MKLMKSRRVQMSLVLSIIMVLVGFSAQALAGPDCECPRVCDLTDEALEKLDTAYFFIEETGIFYSKGRMILRRAKIKILRAKIALIECGLEAHGYDPGIRPSEIITLIEKTILDMPAAVRAMLDVAEESIKPELLLTASLMAIDHAIVETYDGLCDRDALNNIRIAKRFLRIVQRILA